jgi:hypothetical protein
MYKGQADRALKRTQADARKVEYDKLSTQDKLLALTQVPGKAAKQRARLSAKLEAECQTAAPNLEVVKPKKGKKEKSK